LTSVIGEVVAAEKRHAGQARSPSSRESALQKSIDRPRRAGTLQVMHQISGRDQERAGLGIAEIALLGHCESCDVDVRSSQRRSDCFGIFACNEHLTHRTDDAQALTSSITLSDRVETILRLQCFAHCC
jgi:hypothetical protein